MGLMWTCLCCPICCCGETCLGCCFLQIFRSRARQQDDSVHGKHFLTTKMPIICSSVTLLAGLIVYLWLTISCTYARNNQPIGRWPCLEYSKYKCYSHENTSLAPWSDIPDQTNANAAATKTGNYYDPQISYPYPLCSRWKNDQCCCKWRIRPDQTNNSISCDGHYQGPESEGNWVPPPDDCTTLASCDNHPRRKCVTHRTRLYSWSPLPFSAEYQGVGAPCWGWGDVREEFAIPGFVCAILLSYGASCLLVSGYAWREENLRAIRLVQHGIQAQVVMMVPAVTPIVGVITSVPSIAQGEIVQVTIPGIDK